MTSGKADAELNKLIAESEAAIKRVEQLQKGNSSLPAGQRISRHVKKQGANLTNIVLAGTLFGVAYLRLNDKWQHQAEQEQWQDEKTKLQNTLTSLQRDLHTHRQTIQGIEDAVAQGGRSMQSTLSALLDGYRASIRQIDSHTNGELITKAGINAQSSDSGKPKGRFLI